MSCEGKPIEDKDRDLHLKIEGKEISLVPFVHDSLRDVIIAFTKNLKDHEGGKIEIVIE